RYGRVSGRRAPARDGLRRGRTGRSPQNLLLFRSQASPSRHAHVPNIALLGRCVHAVGPGRRWHPHCFSSPALAGASGSRKETITHGMVFRRHSTIAASGARRPGGSRARRGGTTVVELLATVAVLGTFVGTTMLTSSQVRPLYIVRGAARQVAADLQKTRMSAVTENNRYLVQFTSN